MTLQRINEILVPHRADLAESGVRSLAVFGSVVRGEARADSDIDMLVEFERPVGLFALARLQRELTAWLGRPVDLVEPDALRRQLRDGILAEAVRAG
jgi:predicted nucleotidyltransferase